VFLDSIHRINTEKFVDSNSQQQRVELLPRYRTTVDVPEVPGSHLHTSSSPPFSDPHHKPIPTHTRVSAVAWTAEWSRAFFSIKEATIVISAHDTIAILDDHNDDLS
jgi:hypothetical protein